MSRKNVSWFSYSDPQYNANYKKGGEGLIQDMGGAWAA